MKFFISLCTFSKVTIENFRKESKDSYLRIYTTEHFKVQVMINYISHYFTLFTVPTTPIQEHPVHSNQIVFFCPLH